MRGVAPWADLDTSVRVLLVRPVEAIAFWAAIVLPFLYIPLLVAGIDTFERLVVFVGLILLNVVAFIVGHHYNLPS